MVKERLKVFLTVNETFFHGIVYDFPVSLPYLEQFPVRFDTFNPLVEDHFATHPAPRERKNLSTTFLLLFRFDILLAKR